MKPFRIRDCALVVRMADQRSVFNLRELYDRIYNCSTESIYHHFCETPLRPTFDDPEFRNDFAAWSKHALHDDELAERLGILDPYDFNDLEDLRHTVLDIIDERLSEVTLVPWARPGKEFHFLEALTVVFDTGHQIENPVELPYAISRMTTSSLYYHFLEARRRVEGRLDDFSAWLVNWDEPGKILIDSFSEIDFYFLTLKELQSELSRITANILREVSQI